MTINKKLEIPRFLLEALRMNVVALIELNKLRNPRDESTINYIKMLEIEVKQIDELLGNND